MTTNRKIGAGITIAAALIAVAGLTVGHLGIQIAVGVAVIGIVIGTGVARGRFSSASDNAKKN